MFFKNFNLVFIKNNRYGLLFTASFVDKLKDTFSKSCSSRFQPDYQAQTSFNRDYKSAKNLNDIIDVSPDVDHKQALKQQQHCDELEGVEDVDILGDSLFSIENNNYKYIFNLLNKRKEIGAARTSGGGLRFIEKSFLYNLFERVLSRIYTNVPYMKV